MGRIRSIKPEFPHSEDMGRVSRDARLLFIMLFTIADDEGRGRAASRMLASLLFPYDEDAPLLIPQWLMELERQNCIVAYTVNGNIYFQIVNWTAHQRIDKPTKSKLPPPPERKKPRERSKKPREDSFTDKEGNGIGEEGKGISSLRSDNSADKPRSDLPEWIPPRSWLGFVEMRKKIRAPLTPRGQSLLIAKLERMRDTEDVGAVLDQSTMNSWKGVFPVKQAETNGRKPTAHDSFLAGAAAAIDAEFIKPGGPRPDSDDAGAVVYPLLASQLHRGTG